MISQDIVKLLKANTIFALGTANGNNEPFYTRCFLVDGEEDDTKLRIHIPEIMSKRPLQDLKENPRIALTLADMTNFFARQVKGKYVDARPSSKAEIDQINQFQDKIKEIMNSFFGPELADGWKRYIVDPSVCITMEVQDLFEQTPRKGTGEKLL